MRAKYRRRRLGALFVVAVLSFALYAGAGAGAEQATVPHTVAPGETLWEIAVENTLPGQDPRLKVEAIRDANDLSGSTIHPGMTLRVPPAV
jgi:LysM repeat protein